MNVLFSAEADVGHASGKARRGEQITRHGAALSAYRGNEPADQIGGSRATATISGRHQT